MGPYRTEIWEREWCRGFLRRWRWPMIGRDGGDGGSLAVCFGFGERKSLRRREERRREIAIKRRGSMVISFDF
jgi:hypothetical protein